MQSSTINRIAERFSQLGAQDRRTVFQKIRQEGMAMNQFPILRRDNTIQHKCPASYAQARQWFLWQLDPDSSAYHISGAIWLTGELNLEVLRDSFDALIQQHESLRTLFRSADNGNVEQVIHAASPVNFRLINLTDVKPDEDPDARIKTEVRQFQNQPFDLMHGPLLRVALIREAANRHLLVVVMHHIISDGWSVQIMIEDFAAQYRAQIQHTAGHTENAPIQYADYAIWQRHWLEAGAQESQLEYWKSHLGDVRPVLQLPTDRSPQPGHYSHAAHYSLTLSSADISVLRERVKAEGTTFFTILLAAFQGLLYRYTGQTEIQIGVPNANRYKAETRRIIGLFVNTQVLGATLNGRTRLGQLLQQTMSAISGAQSHQDLPFEQLVEALQPERHLDSNPLFQVMFNHQLQDQTPLQDLPGLQVEEFALEPQSPQFDLVIDSTETTGGEVSLLFTYAKDLFNPDTISRMAGHYLALLRALADLPEQCLGDVELLDVREQVNLRNWGTKDARFTDLKPVHKSFEHHARTSPSAPALVFGNQRLTYAELNSRANRLAHHLRLLGVTTDARVGIAVERSVEMIVGMLAILKAGGAYLPLDPELPKDRLAYMIENSKVTLLLTHYLACV
ncbi:MAG: hypothetical protein B0W54_19505 [Cellvibrio sp. 79]|nr:MAG: hypothetical protein B0W54_19505 [Cellvibrio sp. 79]